MALAGRCERNDEAGLVTETGTELAPQLATDELYEDGAELTKTGDWGCGARPAGAQRRREGCWIEKKRSELRLRKTRMSLQWATRMVAGIRDGRRRERELSSRRDNEAETGMHRSAQANEQQLELGRLEALLAMDRDDNENERAGNVSDAEGNLRSEDREKEARDSAHRKGWTVYELRV